MPRPAHKSSVRSELTRRRFMQGASLAATGTSLSCGHPGPVAPPSGPEKPAPWPQASGPAGTFRAAAKDAPTKWSVARNQNILWRTPLPGGGQGGVIAWGDRLYVSTFPAYEGGEKFSNVVLGHALDRATGRILWSVRLTGTRKSPMLYAYSDASSWTPITDGTHVWFFNPTGEMGCYDRDGTEVWRRPFLGQPEKYPFNRQHEPFAIDDTIVSVEPLAADEPGYRADRADWSFLRGIDKRTGKTRWIAEDGTTFYCTPVMGRLRDGTAAVLHGRGGPHDVPERPIGLSLTSLAPGKQGKTLWHWEPAPVPGGPVDGTTFMALYTMTWDDQHAYWFRNAPEESQMVLDINTGKLLRTQSLQKNVDVRQWDEAQGKYVLHQNIDIRALPDSPAYPLKPGEALHVLPNWHGNLVAGDHHYFFTSTNNRRNSHAPRGHSGPAHCIGRVNVHSGKVEYLEVPVGVQRSPGQPDKFLFGHDLKAHPLDNQGQDVAEEERSRTDGWTIPAFFHSPILLGNFLYMGTMLGLTYVIDTRARIFDERALVSINDLGPIESTWALAGPSFSDGVLYHHSLKEVVAITTAR